MLLTSKNVSNKSVSIAVLAVALWWLTLSICHITRTSPRNRDGFLLDTAISCDNSIVSLVCLSPWWRKIRAWKNGMLHEYSSSLLDHTHTRLTALFPGLPRWAGTRKGKPIWILLKHETVSGSGISWAICKSAPRSRQITTPAPHHSHCLISLGKIAFLKRLSSVAV